MNLDDLADAVANIPPLPEARCRGMWHAFDPARDDETPEQTAQRHQLAIRICHRCPELAPCNRWVGGLSVARLPGGIVAAKLRNPRLTHPKKTA